MMEVTILGSGTCVPSLRRSSCSILLESDGDCLLFDCGAGTIRRLLETGKTLQDITHIFLSHFHPDHSAELISILFSTKYAPGIQRNKTLRVMGGAGLQRLYRGLKLAYGNWIVPEDNPVELTEIDPKINLLLEINQITVRWVPVNHNPESLAYRISDGQHSVVYSGDTDDSKDLVAFARRADVLICESAFPDEQKTPGHLCPSAAGRIAREAQVGKLVLTHLYPACDRIDIMQQCRKSWSGPLEIAADLLPVRL